MHHLLPHQQKALDFIHEVAAHGQSAARQTIKSILARAHLNESLYDLAITNLQSHAQVVLHFHPERLSDNGNTVAEGLLQDGIYRNQYETGLSSGSPTAFPGGERDIWEKRLFGGAYHHAGVDPSDRPKYGALKIMYHPDGAAPRFGSCYFILKTDVNNRSTFTFGGSNEDSALERTGTLNNLEPVMAALLAEVEQGHGTLGVDNLTVKGLFMQMAKHSDVSGDLSKRPLGHALDSFIEVQVHGAIHLHEDVEKVVVDPAFRETYIEQIFRAMCSKYDIKLDWHPGFTLPVSSVPEYFRGYNTRALAQRIVENGVLDAAKIGAAANSLETDPDMWRDFGSYEDILTCFRRLWHVLVLYGQPACGT